MGGLEQGLAVIESLKTDAQQQHGLEREADCGNIDCLVTKGAQMDHGLDDQYRKDLSSVKAIRPEQYTI